jgi:hypothetical protein
MPLTPPTTRTCPCCYGRGYIEQRVLNLGTRDREWAYVPCPIDGCNQGRVVVNVRLTPP